MSRIGIGKHWGVAAAGRFWGCAYAVMIGLFAVGLSHAQAADHIRIATLKTGTLAWELEVARAHGLDMQANLTIDAIELASTEAGKIALKGGAADVIVSDWLWVARERALGDNLMFYPYSSALGAVMVPADLPVRSVGDLKSKKLGVAGGPLDKSWLLLRALALRSGIDLKSEASIVYGAPPLLAQKALQGETDATLTFWNFSAALEAKGMRPAIPMQDVVRSLGAAGEVAMVGYVFDGGWAVQNRALLDRFFAVMRKAEWILADTPAEWGHLAPRIGVTEPDALEVYRRRFREGIPKRPLPEEIADARYLYRVLASIGGPDLVGPSSDLEPGAFYTPGSNE
jgi:NitT/TauT family transport system substrate-binding protein